MLGPITDFTPTSKENKKEGETSFCLKFRFNLIRANYWACVIQVTADKVSVVSSSQPHSPLPAEENWFHGLHKKSISFLRQKEFLSPSKTPCPCLRNTICVSLDVNIHGSHSSVWQYCIGRSCTTKANYFLCSDEILVRFGRCVKTGSWCILASHS